MPEVSVRAKQRQRSDKYFTSCSERFPLDTLYLIPVLSGHMHKELGQDQALSPTTCRSTHIATTALHIARCYTVQRTPSHPVHPHIARYCTLHGAIHCNNCAYIPHPPAISGGSRFSSTFSNTISVAISSSHVFISHATLPLSCTVFPSTYPKLTQHRADRRASNTTDRRQDGHQEIASEAIGNRISRRIDLCCKTFFSQRVLHRYIVTRSLCWEQRTK